jgi:hypothetical protein
MELNENLLVLNQRREVESMTAQAEMLRRQVNSMKARINILEDMAGGSPHRGGEMDQLTLKIEEAADQVTFGSKARLTTGTK